MRASQELDDLPGPVQCVTITDRQGRKSLWNIYADEYPLIQAFFGPVNIHVALEVEELAKLRDALTVALQGLAS